MLIEIALLWILSDIGYYALVYALGIGSDYSTRPIVLGLYYLAWVGIALYLFWDLYKGWKAFEVNLRMFFILTSGIIAVAVYLVYILPLFPPILWTNTLEPPSELLSASMWYFFPKSIEIALQQLLVVAMVLSFDMRRLSLKSISLWSATLFGGMHLLLVLGGGTLSYVIGFSVSAVIAGCIFPYLIVRVHNGFLYSYFIHWGFYAVAIVLVRILF